MRTGVLRGCVLPALAFVLLCASASRASDGPPAETRTREVALDELSGVIVEYMRGKKDRIIVGEFKGPALSSIGVEIRRELEERLKSADVLSTDENGYKVRGACRMVTRGALPTIVISCEILNRMGEVQHLVDDKFPQNATERTGELAVEVANQEDTAALTQTTADLTPNRRLPVNERARDRANRFVESVKSPTVHVEQAVVAASETSPYRIEILVKDPRTGQYHPRPVENRGGLAFVDLQHGEAYAVRLINQATDHAVGVKILIDGLSMFEFSEVDAYKRLQMVYVPEDRTGIVRGWHINDKASHEFLIAELEQSAALKVQRETADIGVITVQFFPAWTGNEIPAVALGRSRSASPEDKATAVGQRIGQRYEPVTANFGELLLAQISVRYAIPDRPEELPSE